MKAFPVLLFCSGLFLPAAAIVMAPDIAVSQATVIPSPPGLDPIKSRLGALEAVVQSGKALRLIDDSANASNVLNIDHNGAGAAQAYGINIYNRPDSSSAPTAGAGAKSAFVIHQYSDSVPAVVVDNTRSQAAIRIRNAANSTNSAGTYGTGDFLDFWGYSTTAVYPSPSIRLGVLNQYLGFYSYDSSRPWSFVSTTTADSLQVSKGVVGGRALYVTSASPAAAVHIDQTGAAQGLIVNQSGAAIALQVSTGAGSAGFWPLKVDGQNFGPKFTTTTNSGQTLTLQKDGTGAGEVLFVTNKGTGKTVSINNATRETASIDVDGMPRFGAGNTAAPPAANSACRGKVWVQEGGSGVADKISICLKSAAETYSWIQIATGG